ncbi:RNI-like protein [Gigaspora margarita]|uniref:RNI-like protein n=1 Tax=Gigaspora margarita TaxID=4874 RepID=A0A8H4B5T7_GIGMA|nr:RNI-like protein [Gigaspora margarita]
MISLLPDECLLEIFNNLYINYRTLFSCLLVNIRWCRIIIPILWSEPTKYFDDLRLIRAYLLALNVKEQALLIPLSINLPNYQKPLFEYPSFTTYVGFYLVDRKTDGVKNWLYREGYEENYINDDYYYDGYNYYDDHSYCNFDYQEFNEHVNTVKRSLIVMFLRTALAKTLYKNTTLTSLSIRHNYLGSEGVKALARALYKNNTLKSLDNGRNHIKFKGVEVLSKALCINTTLTSLDLSFNSLGPKSGKTLAEVLYKNTALTSLSIYGNQLGFKNVKTLEAFHNKITLNSLTFDDLNRNSINSEEGKAIAMFLCKHSIMFIHGNLLGSET